MLNYCFARRYQNCTLTLIVFITIPFTFSGCSLTMSPLAARATAFSSTAALAAEDSEDAYTLVQTSYSDVQTSSLIIHYDRDGFHPDQLAPFLSDSDLKARQGLLAGLKQYADTLADLSGSTPLTNLETASTTVGQSLQTLAKNNAIPTTFQKTIGAQVNGASVIQLGTVAVAAIGDFLVEHKRDKELPHIIEGMQQPIDNACALLEADIGPSTTSPGLRSQIANDYSQLLMNEDTYIRTTTFPTPSERRTEILKLPALVQQRTAADHTLIATLAVLQKFAAANHALAASLKSKTSPDFKQQLSELASDAEHLKNAYDDFNTPKGVK